MPQASAYFDTSVVVKHYLREDGSRRARALLRRYRLLSSAVTPLEVFSALSRRRAAGELTERDFAALLTRIEGDRAYWDLLEVSAGVLEQAERLVRDVALRTLDAVHLASFLTVRASGLRIPFVTADQRQRDVAGRRAADVVWVG